MEHGSELQPFKAIDIQADKKSNNFVMISEAFWFIYMSIRTAKSILLTSLDDPFVSNCSQIKTRWQTAFFIFHPTDTSSCHPTIGLISFQGFCQCCRMTAAEKNKTMNNLYSLFFLIFSSTDLFLCECTGLKHCMSEVISSTNNVHSCLFLNRVFSFSFKEVTL